MTANAGMTGRSVSADTMASRKAKPADGPSRGVAIETK